jgi:hypothetical protein
MGQNLLNKHSNNTMLMFLFSAIGLSLFSLFVSVIMVNAQAYPSGSIPSGSSTNGETHDAQMGICVVGVGGPCNGDTNSPK